MDIENLNLKRCLVLQSFAPLFLLLFMKHLDISLYLKLVHRFWEVLVNTGISAFSVAVNHVSFGSFIISIISTIWLIITIVIALGFNGMQKAGFKSAGEQIIIEDSPNYSGATFLVTYVLPLLTDDVEKSLEEKNIKELIAQALEQLSPRQREIFELSRNRGLSHKEIAEQLGLSVYTVQDHIKNALEKIRAYLIPFISACPILVSLIILKYVKP